MQQHGLSLHRGGPNHLGLCERERRSAARAQGPLIQRLPGGGGGVSSLKAARATTSSPCHHNHQRIHLSPHHHIIIVVDTAADSGRPWRCRASPSIVPHSRLRPTQQLIAWGPSVYPFCSGPAAATRTRRRRRRRRWRRQRGQRRRRRPQGKGWHCHLLLNHLLLTPPQLGIIVLPVAEWAERVGRGRDERLQHRNERRCVRDESLQGCRWWLEITVWRWPCGRWREQEAADEEDR